MEGRVLRRSVTLADQLAAVGPAGTAAATAAAGSCNLRDLLKLRDEDDLAAGRRAAVTLASAMAAERLTVAPASSAAAAAAAAPHLAGYHPGLPPPVVFRWWLGRRSGNGAPARGATVQQHLAFPSAAASASVSAAAEDEAEAEAGKGAAGGGCCCVCMARAKGAAFIPCGHTFCRTCARELLAGRGRCPLCNAAILDVLDIF
ncbi:hypothetical protein OsJ_28017 [Oryza sativa Japonica Group]|uniref:RING-type domain-containing protein n=1 Tax=Oryza sativa subsp. japonica TaxID=39947 RepID=B9G1W8_ORYSJ|nr:hypothetical protein OsJ_28017 [Oryza sativa Japonica Group]